MSPGGAHIRKCLFTANEIQSTYAAAFTRPSPHTMYMREEYSIAALLLARMSVGSAVAVAILAIL